MPTPPLPIEVMQQAVKALQDNGHSISAAARATGIARTTLQHHITKAREAGLMPGAAAAEARKGWAPEFDVTHLVPDGFRLKGTSTYYGKDGDISGQWVKTDVDRERAHELLMLAAKELSATVAPAAPVAKPTKALRSDLLNLFVITDYHLGALAWGEETGADWDVKIAEALLNDWFGAAISIAPPAGTALLANLGDFMHFDGLTAVTPTSGNVLDADTRFQNLVRVAIRVLRSVIRMLLERYERVIVLMAEGNHDIASSAYLREMFAVFLEDEPRASVITRPDPYYCVEWGKTSLFFHHGHKRRLSELETVFIAKFREVFGRTKHSYAHTGHLHHNVSQETNTMTVEQHRTLAAPDSHASRGGWMSGRDAKVITYSTEYGEVSRQIVSAAMVCDRRKAA